MPPVLLNHNKFGDAGPSIVILHGLLGSSRNWLSIARKLQDRHRVFTLDLRNHGASPHTEPFDYQDLAADVDLWARENLDEPFTLVGHSLGGKAAMAYACNDAYRPPEKLVIVDASATPAPPRWHREIAAMQRIDLSHLESRKQAEEQLEQEGIEDWAFRKFLTSNLDRQDDQWRWKGNLPALEASLPEIFESPLEDGDTFAGSTLLIRGGDSSFVTDTDLPKLRSHFPKLKEVTVQNAGHNVHAEATEAFMRELGSFLQSD